MYFTLRVNSHDEHCEVNVLSVDFQEVCSTLSWTPKPIVWNKEIVFGHLWLNKREFESVKIHGGNVSLKYLAVSENPELINILVKHKFFWLTFKK